MTDDRVRNGAGLYTDGINSLTDIRESELGDWQPNLT